MQKFSGTRFEVIIVLSKIKQIKDKFQVYKESCSLAIISKQVQMITMLLVLVLKLNFSLDRKNNPFQMAQHFQS